MKVIWAPRAKKARVAVVRFLYEEYGRSSARKYNEEMKDVISRIKKFPKSGAPEDLLPKNADYRGIPVGQYSKLIYRVLEREIHIDNIWDTRREPKTQAEETIGT